MDFCPLLASCFGLQDIKAAHYLIIALFIKRIEEQRVLMKKLFQQITDPLDIFPTAVAILIENKDVSFILIPENRFVIHEHLKDRAGNPHSQRRDQHQILFFLIADKAVAHL